MARREKRVPLEIRVDGKWFQVSGQIFPPTVAGHLEAVRGARRFKQQAGKAYRVRRVEGGWQTYVPGRYRR